MAINSVNSSNLNIIAQSSSVSKNHKTEQAAKSFENGSSEKQSKVSGKRTMDAIELSTQPAASSPTLAQIKKSLLSEINKDKDSGYINDLKSRLESGKYTVDAQEIAKNMLSEN